jgi:hypothetical protein
MTQLIYRLDKDDKITFVSSNWMPFAKANGMPGTTAKSFLGTRLWRHISDMSLRHFYKVLLSRVRLSGESLTIPYRCDSPDQIRFMEMKITRLKSGELEIRCRQLRKPKSETTGTLATAKMLPQSVVMCLWCDKVETSKWLEPEQAAQKLQILNNTLPWIISHSVCPSCEAKGLSTII